MPLTIVVGGQFGGEGKGKIVSYLSLRDDVDYVVRCGGPNSGHTVDSWGIRAGLRMLPAGFVNKRTQLMLAPGALLNEEVLLAEIRTHNVDPSRIVVDRNACIVTDDYAREEVSLGLRRRIGSTTSGTGVAVSKRALRDKDVRLAKNVDSLRDFVGDVSARLNSALDEDKSVLVEGTQGFGLSLYHNENYPYSTSRDTTASAFLSEVGLSPRMANHIIMGIRTFPIRVEGNSGPLPHEISWETLRKISHYSHPISERTTVTQRIRRVAEFDMDIVRKAARVNRPTHIGLHGVDYLDYRNKGVTDYNGLTARTIEFIRNLEETLDVPVAFIGTGPSNEEIIDRRLKDSNWNLQQVRTTIQM